MSIRPYVVEFLGTPEAGKTSAIELLVPLLEKYNLRVFVIREAAEIVPTFIPKGSFDSNLWMHFHTLQSLVSAKHMKDVDIILVDRGCIDRSFWMTKCLSENLCSLEDYQSYTSICSNAQFSPDLVIALTVNANMSVVRRGGDGRIVTRSWIEDFNQKFDLFYQTISLPKIKVDTTSLTKDNLISILKDFILSSYMETKDSLL